MRYLHFAFFSVIGLGALSLISPNYLYRLRETLSPHSLAGVNACVSAAAGGTSDQDSLRTSCAARHQFEIAPWTVTGQGNFDRSTFSGEMRNKFGEHVVTRIEIVAIFFDETGVKEEFSGIGNTWILPANSREFSAQFDQFINESILRTDWCETDKQESELRNCRTWGVKSTFGVKF